VKGYTCQVTTEAPQPPNLDQGDVITLGQVSDISDPQSGGMVKAKLLAYNNIETDWMQVLYPGAGSQKGFYSVPGKGDWVLLLLPRRNPAQGIVLGGLSGKLGLLANDIKTDESVWVTPSGQKIRMDASGDVIRLENRRGAYIQLSGGDIVIAASAVDFKHLGGL
ncbi:MAG TPA: phage baseplate assembly protein V, partial [Anaerolineales bacterium]